MPRESYRFDPARSRFLIRVSTSGVLALLGHMPTIAVPDFRGTLEFDAESLTGGVFSLLVPTTPLVVNGALRPLDRQEIERQMHAAVLETGAFPEIKFRCQRLEAERTDDDAYAVEFPGELTLHGVTLPERVRGQLSLEESEARLVGEHTLSQAAYKIRRITALAGALSVNDEVTLVFDLVGRKNAP